MNYILHLNAFIKKIKTDDRLSPLHISLYLALFSCWNTHRFQNPFPIHRSEIMQLCKIGNKNTYHKCIRDLDEFDYIQYQKGQVSIVPLLVPASTKTGTIPVPDPVHTNKINIQTKREDPPTQNICHSEQAERSEETILKFFKLKNWSAAEAVKFFNHYKAIGWKIQGITPIEDWQALAQKWMINANKYETKKDSAPAVVEERNLELEIRNWTPTPEQLEKAKAQRIKQIAGVNNYTLQQLWQAYLKNDPENELVKNDFQNLLRIAKTFTTLPSSGQAPEHKNQ